VTNESFSGSGGRVEILGRPTQRPARLRRPATGELAAFFLSEARARGAYPSPIGGELGLG
jgi:hypothetical protein